MILLFSKGMTKGLGIFFGILFVFPFVASADDFATVAASTAGKVILTAQATGFATKGNSVDAPPGSDITLTWTVPSGWKGCWSNWSDTLITGSGTKTAKIPTSQPTGRVFVLTCFGVGQSQTVGAKVNVVKPDLSIASFTGTAVPVPTTPAVAAIYDSTGKVTTPAIAPIPHPNQYYAGTGAITLRAALKNSGKTSIQATPQVSVIYQAGLTSKPSSSTTWVDLSPGGIVHLETNYAIAPGSSPNAASYAHSTVAGGPWYFRVKADSANVVDESNENNNTKIIGPYTFVVRPAGQ